MNIVMSNNHRMLHVQIIYHKPLINVFANVIFQPKRGVRKTLLIR